MGIVADLFGKGVVRRGISAATIGNLVGRTAMTTAAGALIGGAMSDSNTNPLPGMLGGAAIGMGAGLLTSRAVRKGIGKAARRLPSAGWKTAKVGYNLGKGTASIASGVGRWALRNPAPAIGIGLAGLGGVALANSGMGSNNASDKAMMATAVQRGGNSALSGSPDMGYLQQNPFLNTATMRPDRRLLMESAEGLVQGMHRGRHS